MSKEEIAKIYLEMVLIVHKPYLQLIVPNIIWMIIQQEEYLAVLVRDVRVNPLHAALYQEHIW
jgi:hypothetical protein